MPDAFILGIETSCDETAAAVVRSGEEIVSNVVASQITLHQPYGGVVPELASREHLRAIVPVVSQALEKSKQTYSTLDAIAVTQGPGLAGALLVGISYAKALAYALEKPLVAAALSPFEGQLSTFKPYLGPGHPCYRCLFRDPPPPDLVPRCETAGILGAVAGVIGTLQAVEVLKEILGIGDSLSGTLLMYDALGTTFHRIAVPKDPHCPTCGGGAA